MRKYIFIIAILLSGIINAQIPAVVATSGNSGDTPPVQPPRTEILLTTNSTSSIWSPSVIVNSGDILSWEVTGGVIIGEQTINKPTFDLSSNTGSSTITIRSTDNFIGLTNFSIDELDILTTDVLNATKLIDFSCKLNPIYNQTDVTTLLDLKNLTIRSTGLTDVNLVNNTLLEKLWLYSSNLNTIDLSTNSQLILVFLYSNNLPSNILDQVVIDLDTHGLSNGDLRITGNTGNLTEASLISYNNLISKGWLIDVQAPNAPPSILELPVLTNFNIKDTNKDRIYFDATADITGITTTGFVVSNKTISSVTIDADKLGGYFTVSTPFTFWDNNTIRLGELANTIDKQSILYNFSLKYINNNISEPTASTLRYASSAGSGAHDGTSEANAWSYTEMDNSATAGQTVYVKAGTSSANLTFTNSGTPTAPIKFIGYKITPEDITSRYYTYGDGAYKTDEMPTLSGSNRASGEGFDLVGRSYIIIKNFQIENYRYSIQLWNTGGQNIVFNNVTTKSSGSITSDVKGYGIYASVPVNSNLRILNSLFFNSTQTNLYISGDNHLIENTKTYADEGLSSGTDFNQATDYHILIDGSNSILRGNHHEHINDLEHRGHGVSLKEVASGKVEYNLIENVSVKNVSGSMEFRHSEVKFNVAKNLSLDFSGGSISANGIVFRDGSTFNLVENSNLFNMPTDRFSGMINYVDTVEDGYGETLEGNIVRNSTFSDSFGEFIRFSSGSTTVIDILNCEIQNCTFSDGANLYVEGDNVNPINFKIKNNIINEVPNLASAGSVSIDWSYSDFFNSFTTPTGTGNINIDPQFIDLIVFEPQNAGLIVAPIIFGVEYDKLKKERADVTTIGAINHASEVIGVVPNFYVALSGDNSDGLTEATAFNNLTTVSAQTFSAGDVIGFRGGDEFYGSLNINSSGVLNNTIKYTSYGSGQAVIKGSESITGWTNTSGNIWEADVTGKTIYQVFKNDVVQQVARYPKIVNDFATDSNFYTIQSIQSSSAFTSTSLIGLDLTDSYAQIQTADWRMESVKIQSFNSGTGAIVLVSAPPVYSIGTSDIFYVVSGLGLLDAPNEWYHNTSTNKLIIYSVGSPVGITANTIDSNAITSVADYIDITNLNIKHFNKDGINIIGDSNTIKDNAIEYCYGSSVLVNGDNNNVLTNIINGSGDIAIDGFFMNNSFITGNTITDTGLLKHLTIKSAGQLNGIRVKDNTTVNNNIIKKTGYVSIRMMGEFSTIKENFIEDYNLTNHDGSGIYAGGDASFATKLGTNCDIDKNIVLNVNLNKYVGWNVYGIYLDDYAHDDTVTNNVLAGGTSLLFLHNTRDINVQFNNFYKSTTDSQMISLKEDVGAGTILRNTLDSNYYYHESTYKAIFETRSSVSSFDYGTLDNNKYFNPVFANVINKNAPTSSYMTLAEWQSFTSSDGNPQDVNSIQDNTSNNGSLLAYNETDTVKIVPLTTGTWVAISNGTSYVTSITLQPYTGEILIKQ